MRVPSPDPQGEGHERCVDLGMQHQRPVGVMGAERSHSPARNRRSVSAPESSASGRRPGAAGNGDAYKRSPELAERRAEVGGGRSSDDRRGQHTRRSERPPAGCATATAKIFGSKSLAGRWGRSPTHVALGNAAGRLPGGKPDEGEPHVRFGKGEQETGLATAPVPHFTLVPVVGSLWRSTSPSANAKSSP